MDRVQFYPSPVLANLLKSDASSNGVSVSQFVTDLLEKYYGISAKKSISITQLTAIVLKEVEGYVQNNKAGGVQKYNNHCKIIIVKYSIAV